MEGMCILLYSIKYQINQGFELISYFMLSSINDDLVFNPRNF